VARAPGADGGGDASGEWLTYAATVAIPLLVGVVVGVVLQLSAPRAEPHQHPYWRWLMGAVVAATAGMAATSWVIDRRRTARGLVLQGGVERRAHVEALLRRGLLVPAEERELAEQVAGAQSRNRWVQGVLPVLAAYTLASAWSKEGSSFWLALAFPALLLPGWARDLLARRAILGTASEQGIVPRAPARAPIPWRR
jgi:hypothetical protein